MIKLIGLTLTDFNVYSGWKIRFVITLKSVYTATNETLSDNIENISRSQNYSQAIMKNTNKQERKLFPEAYNKEISQLQKIHTSDNSKLYNIQDVHKSRIINSRFIFNT